MKRIVPIVLAVALFMENMDSTVIATSLATIARDIGTSPIALKLALTSYYVALAIFIPISGRMADRFGAKEIFRAAIGIFMVGSLACAFANSLEGFVVARFIYGSCSDGAQDCAARRDGRESGAGKERVDVVQRGRRRGKVPAKYEV